LLKVAEGTKDSNPPYFSIKREGGLFSKRFPKKKENLVKCSASLGRERLPEEVKKESLEKDICRGTKGKKWLEVVRRVQKVKKTKKKHQKKKHQNQKTLKKNDRWERG